MLGTEEVIFARCLGRIFSNMQSGVAVTRAIALAAPDRFVSQLKAGLGKQMRCAMASPGSVLMQTRWSGKRSSSAPG